LLSPAFAWLLRTFGVGPVLRRLHANHALLARLLTAVAVCFGVASACSRCPLGAAPLHAGLASLACVLAAVPQALAWRLRAASAGSVLRRHRAGHTLLARTLASARLVRAAGAGSVLRHFHAGLASLACLLTAVAVGFCATCRACRRVLHIECAPEAECLDVDRPEPNLPTCT